MTRLGQKRFTVRRLIALSLACTCILQLLTFVASADEEVDVLTHNGVGWAARSTAGAVERLEKDAAQGKISEMISKANTEFNTGKVNDSPPAMILAYSETLLAMDWLASNAYIISDSEVSGTGADGGYYWFTAYEGYQVVDGLQGISGAVGGAAQQYSELSEFNEQLAEGTLGVPIPPASEQLQGEVAGQILGSKLYREALEAILVNYVDFNVLKIIAQECGIAVDPTDTASSLASKLEGSVFAQDYYQRVMSGDYEVVRTVLSGGADPANPIKQQIDPYIEILHQVSATSTTINGWCGAPTKIPDPDDPEHTITYVSVGTTGGLPMPSEMVSKVTRACWHAMRSSDSNDVSSDQPVGTPIGDVDLSKGLGEAIANIHITRNGVTIADGSDTLKLTDLGWCLLACGCVYDPFVSKAGDTNFVETLNRFVGEKDREALGRALRQALNTRKPLYYSESMNHNWWTLDDIQEIDIGTASPATLATVFHEDESVLRTYFMLKGTMQGNVDSSTYEYVQSSSVSGFSGTFNGSPAGGGATYGTTTEVAGDADVGVNTDLKTAGGTNITVTKEQVTRPIAFTNGRKSGLASDSGKGFYAGLGGLTELILVNARQDCKDNACFNSPDTEFLFVNGLGDIVLSDGTIVLPAIANPALWTYDNRAKTTSSGRNWLTFLGEAFTTPSDAVISVGSEILKEASFILGDYCQLFGLGQKSAEVSGAETGSVTEEGFPENLNYYPYNAAFCNHYPRIHLGAQNAEVTASNDAVIGKMLLSQEAYLTTAVSITNVKSEGRVVAPKRDAIKAMPLQGPVFAPGNDETSAVGMFIAGFATHDGVVWFKFWNDNNTMFVAPAYKLSSSGQPFFPLQLENEDVIESYVDVSAPIVTSCIRYLTDGDESLGRTDAKTANIDLWVYDMVGQAMLGNSYSEQMAKNLKVDYESIVNDQYNRFMRGVRDMVANIMDTLGHIDGVLAMKDGYSSGIFNAIMSFVQQFYVVLVIMLLLVVAVRFLRGNYSFIYVGFIVLFTAATFQVYAVWMPTAIPAAYNFFVNDIVEDLVWSSVTVKAEQYDETYRNPSRVDAMSGNPKPYTATITLYKLTEAEIKSAANQAGVDLKEVKSGKPVYLDQQAGIFLQGDQIKMSLDSLLANNTMRGLYESQWAQVDAKTEEVVPIDAAVNGNPYIVKLTSPYVSMEAYYTPFCQIERAFMINLNNFANIFRIQRNSYSYGKDLYKDAFLFNSFTNSGIFLDPDSDTTNDTLMMNINVDDITGDYMTDAADIITQCHIYMEPFEDWLNLRSVLSSPSDPMKESLWGRMMVRKGYYNTDWTMDEQQEEKLSNLIYYINNMTKQFIVRNQDQLNFCSDENAIKLVALYATTCFTNEVSDPGYWLYPNYINAADIELCDALYGSLTTIKDRNVAMSADLVNVVMMNLGLPGLLMLLLILLLSVVFIFVISYLVPVLYVMFGALLLFKLGGTDSSLGVVKGYAKVTGVTIGLYCFYSVGLRFVRWGGYQWYGYLACVIVMALCVYFLSYVIMSVVSNPLEMGNDVLAKNLFSALDRLTGRRLSRLTTNNIQVNANRGYNYGAGFGARNFLRRTGIDRHLPNSFGRRRGYSGRYAGMDDYYYDSRRHRSGAGFGFGRGWGWSHRASDGGYGGGYGRRADWDRNGSWFGNRRRDYYENDGTRFSFGRRRNNMQDSEQNVS